MEQQKNIGEGVSFNRIRRITGYLVGDVNKRFNDAKRAEEHDRVKHSFGGCTSAQNCGH